MSNLEKEELSNAIVHYLRSLGIHLHPWKTNPSEENNTVPCVAGGLFGVPLHALPISKQVAGVPQFLVDACELLRPHLHVEGLFRKCGSMTRIKALKTRLEAGEHCLEMALPCDVATLVKQFLRALPEPLIPARLQRLLCQVQQQEDSSEDHRGLLMLLVTSLLPPRNVDILRYLFNFLQDVAARCAQNKMDLGNLAVVFAPNLFLSEPCSQLNSQVEEQLRSQAAVVQTLISHASEIGIVPKSLLGKVQAAFSDLDGKRQPSSESEEQKEKEGEGRRRRRRRSVSNFVTETLSKFKASRSLYASPYQEIKTGSSTDTALRTSFNSKRKASEDAAWAPELSVKKRRSGLDSLSFNTFADDAGEPCIQPADWGPIQGKEALSPPSSTVKIQRKRSSSKKKHAQRKHPVQTSPGYSPTFFEQKDTGRKSLRIFSRQSKDLTLPSTSAKAGEPSSWLLMKKMVPETIDSPTSQQKWAQLQSFRFRESATDLGFPRELAKGSNCTPIATKPETPHVAVKCKNCKVPSPGSDYVISGCQELGLDDGFENRGILDKAGYLVRKTQPLAPPVKQDKPIRRSLSWSEGLSMKIPTEETDFSPDEIPFKPRQGEAFPFDLPDAAQLDMEVLVAGVRRLGIPAVCVTPMESGEPGCPENGPRNPLTSTPNLCDSHIPLGEGLHQLNEVPKSRLKHLTLNFQANETAKVPKRKGGRRFGRSISHESGLPLQAEQELPTGQSGYAKKGASVQSPRSPLQTFKAYGRQIFISHKQIMMSFAGLRSKKEAPCPRDTEGPTVATPKP